MKSLPFTPSTQMPPSNWILERGHLRQWDPNASEVMEVFHNFQKSSVQRAEKLNVLSKHNYSLWTQTPVASSGPGKPGLAKKTLKSGLNMVWTVDWGPTSSPS